MAILCLTVPKEVAAKLDKIPVPGKKTDPSSYHVTLFYMPNLKVEQVSQLLELTFNFLKDEKPFDSLLKEVSTFKNGNDGIPIIMPVLSEYLHDWHARLAALLEKAGIDFSKKYPEYKPHLTLSYSKNKKDQDFSYKLPDPVKVHHNTVTYYGSHTGETMFRIPIGGKKKSYSLLRMQYKKALIDQKNKNSTILIREEP